MARYVFEGNAYFKPLEYIYTGQETGMDSKGISKITGFITIPHEAGIIDTPNGKFEFVQLIFPQFLYRLIVNIASILFLYHQNLSAV